MMKDLQSALAEVDEEDGDPWNINPNGIVGDDTLDVD